MRSSGRLCQNWRYWGNPFYDDPEADLAVNKEMNQTIPVDDGFRSEKSTQPSQIDSPAMENKIPMAKSDVGSSGFDLEKWDKECTEFEKQMMVGQRNGQTTVNRMTKPEYQQFFNGFFYMQRASKQPVFSKLWSIATFLAMKKWIYANSKSILTLWSSIRICGKAIYGF